jgi:hypothetical protein
MPRFVGRRNGRVWWDIVALIALVVVVLLALELTGTTHLFGWVPVPAQALA